MHRRGSLLLLFLVVACNGIDFGSGSGTNAQGDGRRPSEQGEGLVGYLTDPDALAYERTDATVKVTGGAGAVAVDGAAVEGLAVCLQQVLPDDLESMVAAGQAFGGAPVKTLAHALALADGSFVLTAEAALVDDAGLLGVNATGKCLDTAGSPILPGRNAIVFKRAADGGGFADPAVLYPDLADDDAEALVTPHYETKLWCASKDPACSLHAPIDVTSAKKGTPIPDVVQVRVMEVTCAPASNPVQSDCVGDELGAFDVVNGAVLSLMETKCILEVTVKGRPPMLRYVDTTGVGAEPFEI